MKHFCLSTEAKQTETQKPCVGEKRVVLFVKGFVRDREMEGRSKRGAEKLCGEGIPMTVQSKVFTFDKKCVSV